jgi:hypothetical protein
MESVLEYSARAPGRTLRTSPDEHEAAATTAIVQAPAAAAAA